MRKPLTTAMPREHDSTIIAFIDGGDTGHRFYGGSRRGRGSEEQLALPALFIRYLMASKLMTVSAG